MIQIHPEAPWICFCSGTSPERSAHIIHAADLGCVEAFFEIFYSEKNDKDSCNSSLVEKRSIHIVSDGPAEERCLQSGQAQVEWLRNWSGYDALFSLFESCWQSKLPAVQKFYVEIEKRADAGFIRGPILQTMAIIACLRGHANILRFVIPRAKELTIWSDFATSTLIKYAVLVGQHPAIWAAMFEENTLWHSSLSFTWKQQLNKTALLAQGKRAVELFTVLQNSSAFFVTAFQLQDVIRDNQVDEKTVKFIVPTLCPALLNLSCGLHLVAARGNLSLMKVFLDCGADPNFIPDIDDKPEPDWDHPWGWDNIDLEPWRRSRAIPVGTALHATVGSDDLLPATKLLLKRGANLRMRDDAGLNPIQKAVYTGATKTAKLLEDVDREPEGLEVILKGLGDGVGKMFKGLGKVFKDEEEWKAQSLPEEWYNRF